MFNPGNLQASVWYTKNKVDFIDAYNAAWLLAEEMRIAYTFARKHFARLKKIVTRVLERILNPHDSRRSFPRRADVFIDPAQVEETAINRV